MKRHLSGLIVSVLTLSIGLFVGWFFAGEERSASEPVVDVETPTFTIQVQEPDPPLSYDWEESISNEKDIGRPRKNKVEIRCVNRNYQAEAEIEFYSLSERRDWTRMQSLRFENLNYAGCDPQFSDFNNDGLKDLTFISGQAARGSNEIRTLLIYDPKKDELIHVKNSAEYPNLVYNERLDCLDAWLFHGATTTVFLELKGDRLEPFATVNTGSHLVVDARDVKGKWHQLAIKRMKPEDVYTRYVDFLPVTPYK